MVSRFRARRAQLAVAAAMLALASGRGSTLDLSASQAGGLGGAAGADGQGATGGVTADGATAPTTAVAGGGQTLAAGGGGSAGAAAAGPSGAAGAATASGASLQGGGRSGSGPAAAGASPRAGSGSAAATATAPQAGDGPGVTATTIVFGSAYDPNQGAENAALGATGVSAGDTKTQENAVASWVNAHGGIAGRQVKVIYQNISATNNVQQTEQGECNYWEQDNKSFFIISGDAITDQCTAQYGAVGLYPGIVAETEAAMAKYPADIDYAGLTIDRSMKITVNGLAKQGYFAPTEKVGIVTWDENDYATAAMATAVPAVEAAGIPAANITTAFITTPQTESDLGATSASVSSAVLKMHAAGVDHVLLFDGAAGVTSSGILCIEWMQQANSQSFYPRYGLNSSSGFSTLAGDYPTKELEGSIGVGWVPALDLASADYAALPVTPNQKLCQQIMSQAGQAPTSADQAAAEYETCDQFFLPMQALAHVAGPLNQQTALAAIDALGTSYQSLSTFGVNFTASQHDGVQLVRSTTFNDACGCYKYDSTPYSAG